MCKPYAAPRLDQALPAARTAPADYGPAGTQTGAPVGSGAAPGTSAADTGTPNCDSLAGEDKARCEQRQAQREPAQSAAGSMARGSCDSKSAHDKEECLRERGSVTASASSSGERLKR